MTSVEPAVRPSAAAGRRLPGLDSLRGLAVLLMVGDHFLVFAGQEAHPVRFTVTRAALPLFALVAGTLWHPFRRVAPLLLAGVLATNLWYLAGLDQADVLLSFALAFGLLALWPASWSTWPLLVLAILQPTTWPIGGAGYEPGVILALVMVGRLLEPKRLDRWGRRLPLWLAAAGRYPLTIYLGHLAVLTIATGSVK